MAKIRIILEAEYDLDQESYRRQPNPNPNGGEDIVLTDEQLKDLTDEEMLELDKKYIIAGEFGLEELIGACVYDTRDDLKLELVEE